MLNRSIFFVVFSLLSFLSGLAYADKLRAVLDKGRCHPSSYDFFDWTAARRKTGRVKDFKARHNLHGSHMRPGFVTKTAYLAEYIDAGNKPTIFDLRPFETWENEARLKPSFSAHLDLTEILEKLRNGNIPDWLLPKNNDEYVVFFDQDNTQAPEVAELYATVVARLREGIKEEEKKEEEEEEEPKPGWKERQEEEAREKWKHVKTVLLDGGLTEALAWVINHPNRGLAIEQLVKS